MRHRLGIHNHTPALGRRARPRLPALLTVVRAGRDAPRGLEFLLLRNRINVAISRAMQAAYVVYSPALLDDLPRTPEGVARLSAFARLVDGAD